MTRPNEHRNDGTEEERGEVGNQASSQKHPPHVSENAEDEPIQKEMISPRPAPVLPANASGSDKVGAEEQDQGIDDESMYDRRPEEESA